MPKFYVHKFYPDAKLPTKAYDTDSGYDVYAYKFKKYFHSRGDFGEEIYEEKDIEVSASMYLINKDAVILQPGERVLIDTGISATVEPGYEIQVRPRSGNALNKGLICHFGTIDEQYRNSIGVILINLSNTVQEIKIGDKIAQLVPAPVLLSAMEVLEELPPSDRGLKGFGSSGS